MEMFAYFCNHHMAIEGASAAGLGRSCDMGPDFGDDRSAECHVWDKMAVHDVYMEPIGSAIHCGRAFWT